MTTCAKERKFFIIAKKLLDIKLETCLKCTKYKRKPAERRGHKVMVLRKRPGCLGMTSWPFLDLFLPIGLGKNSEKAKRAYGLLLPRALN
jgi:hypothetical protein